ncbi:MAG: hypothetical protein Q9195_009057 [Heterodermia aff. obscurata]
MHPRVFSIALLTFLGSLPGTLARPTNSTSPSNTTLPASPPAPISTTSNSTAEDPALEKFGSHYGWAGFFVSNTCDGSPVGDRPKFNDQACRPVTPAADNLGISWGSWPLGLDSLTLFQDDACKQQVGEVSQSQLSGEVGPGSCVSIGQYGGKIGSMQSNG